MAYRPEIDGLRAIAVIVVVFYHAGFSFFKGGFLGVDIFFVISGYLITCVILDGLNSVVFDLLDFYVRRSRRILPSLFFMMVSCIPLAFLFMSDIQIQNFARSLLSASLFVSNIYFWRTQGYFSTDAELVPLLHTWSLAIEEQYYIVFPLLLIFIYGFFRRYTLHIFLAIALFSCALFLYGIEYHSSASFYLVITRVWEFLAGSVVAFWISNNKIKDNEYLSVVGMFLLCLPIFAYGVFNLTEYLYYQSVVLGTSFIILFSKENTVVNKILRLRPFVFLGLMSYSVYLWHQPLFAYFRLATFDMEGTMSMAILTVGSFVFGYLSWRFIEHPFRYGRYSANDIILKFSAAGVVAISVISAAIILTPSVVIDDIQLSAKKILPGNYFKKSLMYNNAEEEQYTNSFSECIIDIKQEYNIFETNYCDYDKKILIVGDSHSRDLYQMFGRSLDNRNVDFQILSVHKGGCRLTDTVKPHCVIYYQNLLRALNETNAHFEKIIYVQALRNLETDGEIDFSQVNSLVESLRMLGAHSEELIWLGPRSGIGLDRSELLELCFSQSESRLEKLERRVQSKIEKGLQIDLKLSSYLEKVRDLRFVRQNELLRIDGIASLTDCSELYWSDPDHLSKRGEEVFGPVFLKALLKAGQDI